MHICTRHQSVYDPYGTSCMATAVGTYNVCVCTCLDTLHTQRVFYVHAGGKVWEQIAWLLCCYEVIWHNRSWNVQAHHECIRYWEGDQSLYKCIDVHIMCNNIIHKAMLSLKKYKAPVTFLGMQTDYVWLWLTLFWHWLVYQGGPVIRAQTQVQCDKQETRKRLPQDCQIQYVTI